MKWNEKAPKVTVIIPAFNYARFLPDALLSLQQQTFTGFECLVVDDGSTDDTRTVVESVAIRDPRFRYLYQQNTGQPSARNAGLARAEGKYIQFLDADDRLQPGKLKWQVGFLEEHAAVSVVYGDVRYFTSENPEHFFFNRWGNADQPWMPGLSGIGLRMISGYVEQNIFELGCALFRADALNKGRYFDPSLQGVEDYDFCFRLALQSREFSYQPSPDSAVLMRHHTDSFSKSRTKMYQREVELRHRIAPLLVSVPNLPLSATNHEKILFRLRQLSNLLIDETRRGQRAFFRQPIIGWLWQNTSLRQKLYFFPRWVKAGLLGKR